MTTRYHLPWAQMLLFGWLVLFAWSAMLRIAPPSDWFVVDSILVEDAKLGEDPVVHVERTIKQVFTGQWTIDVEREAGPWKFEHVCSANGQAVYRPDNVLSRSIPLSHWVADYCIPEEPGRYRLDAQWMILLPGGLTKMVDATSNTFTVTE